MPGRNVATHRLLVMRAWAYQLRESLFYLPALCVLLSVAATFGVRELGRHFNPFPLNLSPDAAITLLATTAAAVITTSGVVFSITVVSVQLASQQFSPRVVRGYFRDRFGQAVVGWLVATFAYCLLSLRVVGSDKGEHAPDLIIEVALIMAIASVLLIVAYLDRSTRHLYVGTLLKNISEETIHLLADLRAEIDPTAEPHVPDLDSLGPGWVVAAQSDGWVQQVSSDGLLRAVDPGSVVRVETRIGAFIVAGGVLATVWPEPPDPDRLARDISAAVFIGDARTMQQDIDFGLRQMNDVALRALSAAINDPTTAIEAMLRVGAVMHRLLAGPLPTQVRRDEHGSLLLRPWELDHEEYVVHAYAQVRLASASHPAIVAVLLRTLRQLSNVARQAGNEEAADACDKQLRLLIENVEQVNLLDEDRAWLQRIVERPLLG